MNIFHANNFEALKAFDRQFQQLAIFNRPIPEGAEGFFQKLSATSFGVAGEVRKTTAQHDIRFILSEDIPTTMQDDPFYELWLSDMADVSALFCEMEQSDKISFWLGSKRGCRRYHIDNVPQRLLVTYAGKGTEWLPDDAADREAFIKGEPNEKIVRDVAAKQFIHQWDIAIFSGGPKGPLHRTPDQALDGFSILMRLDNESFWKNIQKTYQKPKTAA